MPRRATGPTLKCARLQTFDIDDWAEIGKAFARAPVCRMGQAWRARPQPRLQPAEVRVGWRARALYVYARLGDMDIFNRLRGYNRFFYLAGDVFEIFVRPTDLPAYCEFHVTPANDKFQLQFPGPEAIDAIRRSGDGKKAIARYFLPSPIRSRTRVLRTQNRWDVLAVIPFALVGDRQAAPVGRRWRYSFCRYDYTRGRVRPILSSTSPHRRANYHSQAEWGTLVFAQ